MIYLDKMVAKNKKNGGFTIVEILIVLSVSGALLVAVLTAIDGRQTKTNFDTSIRQLQNNLQLIVNKVANGDFNYSSSISCTDTAIGPRVTNSGGGTNGGCQYIGEGIEFSNNHQYSYYPVAGLAFSSAGMPISDLDSSVPCPINGGHKICGYSPPDLSSKVDIPGGLSITCSYINSAPSPCNSSYALVGIFNLSCGGNLSNAYSDNVNLYYLSNTTDFHGICTSSSVTPAISGSTSVNSLYLCFDSPDGNSAKISFNSENNPSSVGLTYQNGSC